MTKKCFGLQARNAGQEAALTALLDPSIELVIIEGTAGGGKTLLTLAAGLEQVMENKMYSKILWTRAPVAVGYDMGHLPGTIEEKLAPWMGAVCDNLEYLRMDPKDVERYIEPIPIMHIRGRSFMKKYLVIDECSNLTNEEIKVILTRAGEDTKVVLLGCRNQVDNKKLSKENNGLVHVINYFEKNKVEFVAYVALPECERSQLAEWSNGLC